MDYASGAPKEGILEILQYSDVNLDKRHNGNVYAVNIRGNK